MLNIIYSKGRIDRGDVPQGKKTLMRFLQSRYGVTPIKKYTSQEVPPSGGDENLIYLGKGETEEEFKEEICKYVQQHASDQSKWVTPDAIYVYSRVKRGKTYYYGIKKSDIVNALKDEEKQYSLVCTNIECLRKIKQDAVSAESLTREINGRIVFQLKAYCLVRQKGEEEQRGGIEEDGNIDFDVRLNEALNRLSQIHGNEDQQQIINEIIELLQNGRSVCLLRSGEDQELDFFRNVSLFSNLLLIPDCGDISGETGSNIYKEKVSPIVEKYMGLKQPKDQKKIFVIHPISDWKFKLIRGKHHPSLMPNHPDCDNIEDIKRRFFAFVKLVFKHELESEEYKIEFAESLCAQRDSGTEVIGEIIKAIEEADMVICDFRYFNQNCFFEAGYAYALRNNKKVYFVVPTQHKHLLNTLAFDVNGMTFEEYNFDAMIGKSQEVIKQLKIWRQKFELQDKDYSKTEADVSNLASIPE